MYPLKKSKDSEGKIRNINHTIERIIQTPKYGTTIIPSLMPKGFSASAIKKANTPLKMKKSAVHNRLPVTTHANMP